MSGAGGRQFWTLQRWWLLLALATLVHAVVAASTPISGDEAYYWDLSRRPDWATFDQPSLVLWLMIPFRALLGETALAVRSPAILASLAIGLAFLPLARRLGGDVREAAVAYLLLHATPFFLLGSSYVSTDVLMTAWFVGAAWAIVAIAQGERRAWWGFALCAGLGFNSKFPMVAVLIGLLPLLWIPKARAQLATPTPWLGGLFALALTAPVWIWGAQHDWDNILFQFGRVPEAGFTLKYVFEFLGANLGLSSLTGVAFVVAWWKSRHRREPGWVAFRWVAAAPLILFALFALRGRVAAHWGAPTLVLSGLVLAFHPFRGWKAWTLAGGATTAALLVLVFVVTRDPAELVARARTQPESLLARVRADKLTSALGYEETVETLRAQLRPGELVASESYSLVHMLAFVSGGTLPAHLAQVNRGSHGLSALYWHPPEYFEGRDLVYVTGREQTLAALEDMCEAVQPLEPVRMYRDGVLVREIFLARCIGAHPGPGVMSRLSADREP